MKTKLMTYSPAALLATAFFVLSATASAQDAPEGKCATDDDCPSGGECLKDSWVDGCAPAEDGDTSHCSSEVHESEFGTCYVPPEPCDSDKDCEEYMSCQEGGSDGVCIGDENGDFVCEESESVEYCMPEYGTDCEVDDDCPREFECVMHQTACPTIDCVQMEGVECDVPECEPEERGQCEPKEIECEGDDACPSGWSCMGTLVYECSGGGGTEIEPILPGEPTESGGEDDGEPPPTDGDSAGGGETSGGSGNGGSTGDSGSGEDSGSSEDSEREDAEQEEDCKPVEQVGRCMPDVWAEGDFAGGDLGATEGSILTGSDGENGSGEERNAKSSDDDLSEEDGGSAEESGGGCSVSSNPNPSGMTGWLLGLLVLVPFARRRRSV